MVDELKCGWDYSTDLKIVEGVHKSRGYDVVSTQLQLKTPALLTNECGGMMKTHMHRFFQFNNLLLFYFLHKLT